MFPNNKNYPFIKLLGLFLLMAASLFWGGELLAQTTSEAAADLTEPNRVEEFYAWIESLGVAGYGVYAASYILATVFFFPGSILTIGAGLLFGVITGSILVSISSVAGAALAFLVARYLARERIEKKFGKNRKFAAIDGAIGREGWKIVLLLRLTPLLPFNLSNYLYGLTSVAFWPYVLASWIGMIPGTILYVYIGSLGKTAAEAAAGGADTGKLALNAVAFLATIAVTVYVTKIARKALKDAQLDPESGTATVS